MRDWDELRPGDVAAVVGSALPWPSLTMEVE
jgi:hypothetical protein